MIATVELYEPKHDHLKTVSKHGKKSSLKFVVKIGPLVFIKPSAMSANNFLFKKGFMVNEDVEWELKFKSDEEVRLDYNYIKR